MKNKKFRTLMLILILVLALSIGFALLSTQLKINGTAGISANTWDIHWENVDNELGITPIGPAEINASDNTEVDFEVDFTIPGEYYEFTVDAVNRGTIDGMFKVMNTTINGTSVDDIADYIRCTITYADGTTPEEYDLLAVNKQITYRVKIEYLRTITNEQLKDIPNDGEPFSVTVQPVYIQSDPNAVDKGNTTDIPVVAPVQVGEYFTLVPDAEQATTTISGFSGSTATADQTLWRVINVNADGTMEAVSEYISTSDITIAGTTNGYKNAIAGLQDVASCYAKEGYTVATRMMGYNGQTLVLSTTSYYDGTSSTEPQNSDTPTPTSGEGEEYLGGVLGDTLYLRDYQLVGNLYKTDSETYGNSGIGATDKTGYKDSYWLASRKYLKNSGGFSFNVRFTYDGDMYSNYLRTYEDNEWKSEEYSTYNSERVRPIITIKSDLTIASGTGTKTDPFIFD